jgi:AraC-like DNA-binding protein
MPDEYTILPTESARFNFSLTDSNIDYGFIGVNTRASCVGRYANKMKMMLLIEFHTGGLYPFIPISQNELSDMSLDLCQIDKPLAYEIGTVLLKSKNIDSLIQAIDGILLNRLNDSQEVKTITSVKNEILMKNGNIHIRELSSAFFYSEKHIRRMFNKYIGASPKMFSRIVRINNALRLLQCSVNDLSDIAVQTGFFDQPHFIHDFKYICGLTPREYMRNMSVFYNDNLKI